jgi:ubiquitin carboxyl-terminal hydrolase L3
MSARQYAAHFIPLESNPEVFTDLIHNLGISQELRFEDVLSLDEPEWLPRPALALILVFPTSDTYEQDRVHREAQCKDEENDDQDKDVIWYRQTIHNACGLYAILHAISNGKARSLIRKCRLPIHGQQLLTILSQNQEVSGRHF